MSDSRLQDSPSRSVPPPDPWALLRDLHGKVGFVHFRIASRSRATTLAIMRKTFPLHHPRKAPGRVLDAIKHDLRNYVQRERRKPLPEGADRLEFRCKVGADAGSATEVALKQLSGALDAVAQTGATEVFVEITAVPLAREDGPRRSPAAR